jgi:branched-chain amino acid transport system ATP-binding protein
LAGDRLQVVMKDIEKAAAEARKSAVIAPKAPHRAGAAPRTAHTEIDRSAVVIEVYKRPRVEVFRRRPDGGFDRD